jgi:hypothetical protein
VGLFGDRAERKRLERENDRLREHNRDLIDRVMFLSGNPWTPAPADVLIPVEAVPEPDTYVEIDELPTL